MLLSAETPGPSSSSASAFLAWQWPRPLIFLQAYLSGLFFLQAYLSGSLADALASPPEGRQGNGELGTPGSLTFLNGPSSAGLGGKRAVLLAKMGFWDYLWI